MTIQLKGKLFSENEIDSVLNRTLIDKETNIRIGMNVPSEYLRKIRTHLHEHSGDDSALERILASHQLPFTPNSSLWNNDFPQFLKDRELALASLINDAVKNG